MAGSSAFDGRRRLKSGVIAFGALIWAAPLFAQSQDPLAPLPTGSAPIAVPSVSQLPANTPATGDVTPLAVQPAPVRTIPRDWRGVFDAIDAGDWASARAGIATLPPSVLTPLAKAELYTAKDSPVIDLASLQSLIAQAPELPEAEQLAAMAYKRGATDPILIYPEKPTMNLGSAPVRYRAKPVQGEPAADQLRSALDPLIKADDASGAEARLLLAAPQLSVEARAEAGTRVSFVYYVLGLDLDARRVADTWRQGATGEWASQAAWVSGLASWRLGDCESASRDFNQVAALAQQRELRAGALYWAARSEQACGRPQSVTPLLRAAAAEPESYYALVASETLGMQTKL